MSKLQDWCKEISDVVVSAANGEIIQISYDGKTWADKTELAFDSSYKYRIKPRTIKIGDFDVPEPMRVAPDSGCEYFVVEALSDVPAASQVWNGMDCEKRWLSMGLCHKSKESAIAHAKALIALTSVK